MVKILSIRVGIIGAGPAGMASALYLKRSGLDPVLLEKSAPGGQVINTYTVENYLGFNEINGADLSLKMFQQMNYQEIEYKTFDIKNIAKNQDKFIVSNGTDNLEFDKIIIASGKRRRKLNLENEDRLKGISYCAVCDGTFYKDKVVAVIGGGDSALTEAIYLSKICFKVYLLVRNEVRAKSSIHRKVLDIDNIEVINSEVTKLIGTDYLEKIGLSNGTSLNISGLFISIGGIPNNDFINELELNLNNGYIKTNDKMETTEKGIYAVGDIRDKRYNQIATAINDGVIAALSIAEEE